ncbi:hypothetical protein [Undibacterium oligocarboniphilum]|uniref:Uncharacterized protein n=1 Tax=Undibacterium oligocarboniphilum TaxID=666702 RepID=A0A850QIV7_9BURK|nr:hypothetical protein [Undibacterium oligocarboniphilum]MBC3871925.1 hypothetical protein [Undibacterium oligocarboniphilum]NVO79521.1 hypothetical protein [Undibacterium oligocarboniphilum]
MYQHADGLHGHGALDNALGTLNDRNLAVILESWFISIRNQPETSGGDELRWQNGFGFVTAVVSWIAKSNADAKLQRIESRLQQLSVLYSQFRIKKRNSPETIRSLPASTVETLYASQLEHPSTDADEIFLHQVQEKDNFDQRQRNLHTA